MPPLVIFVDDKKNEAEDLIRLLNETGLIEVQHFAPTEDLDIRGLPIDAALFIVDWNLNTLQANGKTAHYLGATFSSRIREEKLNTPIILSTKEDVFKRDINLFERKRFDAVIPKEEIIENPLGAAEKCLMWIRGYEILKVAIKTLDGLYALLEGFPEDDLNVIGSANLPLVTENNDKQENTDPRPATWEIASMARWINEIFLEYPGFVYDKLHAATFLGITVESFEAVMPKIESSKYTGAFAPSQGRWWKSRLQKFAQEIIAEANLNTVSIQHNFSKAFEQKYKTSLAYSQCIYSGESPADWVCYLLKKPVVLQYSLSYYPDNRPLAMDEARVSFRAIRDDNRGLVDEYFSNSDKRILKIVREWEKDER